MAKEGIKKRKEASILYYLLIPIPIFIIFFTWSLLKVSHPQLRIFEPNNQYVIQVNKNSPIMNYVDKERGFSMQYNSRYFYPPYGDTSPRVDLKEYRCISHFWVSKRNNPQNFSAEAFAANSYPKDPRKVVEKDGVVIVEVEFLDYVRDRTAYNYRRLVPGGQGLIHFSFQYDNQKHSKADCEKDKKMIDEVIATFKPILNNE